LETRLYLELPPEDTDADEAGTEEEQGGGLGDGGPYIPFADGNSIENAVLVVEAVKIKTRV
jgi:hypothetical protein